VLKLDLLLPVSFLLSALELGLETRISGNKDVRVGVIYFEFEFVHSFGSNNDDLLARHALSPFLNLSLPLLCSGIATTYN